MISLNKLVDDGVISKTGEKESIPVSMEGFNSQILDVYEIPIKYLYSNDENGRIRAGISKKEGKIVPQNDVDDGTYNDLVCSIIENGDSSFNNTKSSIQKYGQQVNGWVLDDGRIIDGNRRFTAIRKIASETHETKFFKAVILPLSNDKAADSRKIKDLEISFRAIENRVNYSPIDDALDVYETTTEGTSRYKMTIEDFAKKSNAKLKKLQNMYDGVVYMKKFFEYIGIPDNSYDIVIESKIWSLFTTMGNTLKTRYTDSPDDLVKKNQTMQTYFATILYHMNQGYQDSDARQELRRFGTDTVKKNRIDSFNEEVEDITDDISLDLHNKDISNYSELMSSLSEEKELFKEFGNVYKNEKSSAKNGKDIESFLKFFDDTESYMKKLSDNGGLEIGIKYNDFSSDNLLSLRKHVRNICVLSEELFDTYDKES